MRAAERGICTYVGCDRLGNLKGLCRKHYQQQRAGRLGAAGEYPERSTERGICAFQGCVSTQRAKGLCNRHYQQQRVGRLGSTKPHPAQAMAILGIRVPAELPSSAAQVAVLKGMRYADVLREALARGLLQMAKECEGEK